MSELITLSKKDPKFRHYIEGTFSKDFRALPIRSLNVQTDAEQVTFQIISKKNVQPPFLGLHWLQVLKVRNLLLVAFPIFLIFVKNHLEQTLLNPVTGALSALGALCLMTAVNLRNDYLDHRSGLDRIHPWSESRAIQKGWVTADEVRKWSFVYLGLGVLFGLPALALYPQTVLAVGGLAILGIFGMTSFKMGLKYRRWSEWAVFILLGPFLTAGMHYSLGAELDLEVLYLGVLTGGLAVFYLHLKNFEQLMINNQAQFENTMTWLGFESGKKWLFAYWLGFVTVLLIYQLYFQTWFWVFVMTAGLILATLVLGKTLRGLMSPLGSQMRVLMSLGNKMILFVMGLWILQSLWSLWLRP
jgi:1,4-dihydroxy-2-naphthoate octaprenyltransferase